MLLLNDSNCDSNTGMNLHTYFDLSDKKNDKKVFLTEKTKLLKSAKTPDFVAKM